MCPIIEHTLHFSPKSICKEHNGPNSVQTSCPIQVPIMIEWFEKHDWTKAGGYFDVTKCTG